MTTLALTNLPLADSWSMHGGWGWAWMVPMMLGMVLFWGAIIFGSFWLIRDGVQRRQPASEGDGADNPRPPLRRRCPLA